MVGKGYHCQHCLCPQPSNDGRDWGHRQNMNVTTLVGDFEGNMVKTIINHLMFDGYTIYLWWNWGWFIIALPTWNVFKRMSLSRELEDVNDWQNGTKLLTSICWVRWTGEVGKSKLEMTAGNASLCCWDWALTWICFWIRAQQIFRCVQR